MIKRILALPALLGIAMIRYLYQKGIGRFLPKVCIYEPSCSHYTVIAIKRFGLIRGLLLGGWRILRCHPFARGGYDPVPGEHEDETSKTDDAPTGAPPSLHGDKTDSHEELERTTPADSRIVRHRHGDPSICDPKGRPEA